MDSYDVLDLKNIAYVITQATSALIEMEAMQCGNADKEGVYQKCVLPEEDKRKLIKELCQLFQPSGDKPPILSLKEMGNVWRKVEEDNGYPMGTREFIGSRAKAPNREHYEAVAQAQRDALLLYIEQAKAEVVREILDQMVVERCDPDVMAYFDDYYWIPKHIWQALKSKYGVKE